MVPPLTEVLSRANVRVLGGARSVSDVKPLALLRVLAKQTNERTNSMYDPYEDAMTPEPDHFHGQVNVEAFQGFFEKGVGATPYDENAHGDRKHYLIIHFEFTPVDPARKVFSVNTVKWSPEFNQVLRPSLELVSEQLASIKSLVVGQFNPLKEVTSMYVKCERIPRPGNKEGETWTTMKFQAVYPDEATCVAAWEADTGEQLGGSPVADLPFMPDDVKKESPVQDPQRASMAAFLPALWVQSGQDIIKMAGLLKDNPMIGAHFTVESPEVREVMNETQDEIPF